MVLLLTEEASSEINGINFEVCCNSFSQREKKIKATAEIETINEKNEIVTVVYNITIVKRAL